MRLYYTYIIGVVVAAVALTGCATDTATPSDDSNETPSLPRTASGEVDMDAVREASDASQCVKTTLGPCPCNAGGEETAVNERYLGMLQPNQSQADVACPQVYQCTDREPVLVNGSCTLE